VRATFDEELVTSFSMAQHTIKTAMCTHRF